MPCGAFDPELGFVRLMDGLKPEAGEPVLRKTSHNAFTTTNLQQLLTTHGIGAVTICGIRTEQYKLIHYLITPPSYELYDLKADPHETKNLYGVAAHAATQKHLMERLDALQNAVPKHAPQKQV